MASERMESIKQKRAVRQEWVKNKLKTAENKVLDVAEFVGINPRTWREWVAAGSFPNHKKVLILEVLGSTEEEIRPYFQWRPA